MRLDRYLAVSGLGSRSDIKKYISKGTVTVNGSEVKDPGFKVSELTDSITFNGKPLVYEKYIYFMLNKPQGVISATRGDLRNKSEICVIDLISEEKHRNLFPVGRLDKDTEGLLLITDDGALAHDLLSPRKHVDKTYFVKLKDALNDNDKSLIESGIDIGDEKPTLPSRIEMLESDTLNITIHEGRFHEIKRMFQTVGNEVVYLKRISMGSLVLDETLKPGEYRRLSNSEVSSLTNR